MAKQQVKQGSASGSDKSEEASAKRARQDSEEGADVDPRIERASRAQAKAGRTAKGRPASGGKGRDARAQRETVGANAKRGNKPPPEEEEEDEEQEKEETEDLFWKDMIAGVYRSRKRRGDWEESGGPR